MEGLDDFEKDDRENIAGSSELNQLLKSGPSSAEDSSKWKLLSRELA